MSLPAFHKYWGDRSIDSIGVNFSDNADPASVTKRLRSLVVESNGPISLRSDIDIREQSLEIFDRTFAITHVLRLLTVGVAFVGILSALMALSLERRAEYAVLRALYYPFRVAQAAIFSDRLNGHYCRCAGAATRYCHVTDSGVSD